jgi:hypothetical protein
MVNYEAYQLRTRKAQAFLAKMLRNARILVKGVRMAGGQFATMLGIRRPYDLGVVAVVAEQQKHAMQGSGAPAHTDL